MSEPANAIEVPSPPRRRGLWAVATAAALAVAATASVITWLAVRGRPTAAVAPSPSAPAVVIPTTTLITGSIRVQATGNAGDFCTAGLSKFADVRTGAQVTVTGPDGVILAVTELDVGTVVAVEGNQWGLTDCKLPFAVSVPVGKGIYGVEVARRGKVQFKESDFAMPLEMDLG